MYSPIKKLFLTTSVIYLVLILEPVFHIVQQLAFQEIGMAILKGIPIALLACLIAITPSARSRVGLWVAIGFSLLGDTLLAFNLFVPGLGAFLIAQLTYGILFTHTLSHNPGHTKWLLGLAVWLVLIGVVVFNALNRPEFSELRIPVLIYIAAISFMAVTAILSDQNQPIRMVGALLFVLSDSLIALNKFVWPFEYSSFLIMLTYYSAQYLLVTSFILPSKEKMETELKDS